jgi:hypothetical protein
MTEDTKRLDHLVRLRDELLDEMAEADLEFSRVRMALERLESDLRIGRPAPANYTDLKGREFPRAEARFLDLFRQLLKLEDKIKAGTPRSD